MPGIDVGSECWQVIHDKGDKKNGDKNGNKMMRILPVADDGEDEVPS